MTIVCDLDKQNSIHTPIILTIIRNLRPSSPNHLATRSHQTQFTDIDFDYRAFRQYTQLRVHWILRVLLDADDR